jgi:hypothetical protein
MPDISRAMVSRSGLLLEWDGPSDQQYQVQSIPSLTKTNWGTFTNIVSSTNGHFSFLDNGSQTGGLGPVRFYRPRLYPQVGMAEGRGEASTI